MWYDFLLKILFTTFTIGVGFKGGEVTPWFFVGATFRQCVVGCGTPLDGTIGWNWFCSCVCRSNQYPHSLYV